MTATEERKLTNQAKKILATLYTNGPMCSSNLAASLGIQKNSMSNALERLSNAHGDLIQREKKGRRNEYSLTETGQLYVAQMFTSHEDTFAHGEKNIADWNTAIEMCIEELMEVDAHWADVVLDVQNRNENTCLWTCFEKLMQLLQEIKAQKTELYEHVLSMVQNHCTREFIEDVIARRENLIPLWDLAEEDYNAAYDVVELLFRYQGRLLDADDFVDQIESAGIAKKQIPSLVFSVRALLRDASIRKLSEKEFVQILKREGLKNGQFARYIAREYGAYIKERECDEK